MHFTYTPLMSKLQQKKLQLYHLVRAGGGRRFVLLRVLGGGGGVMAVAVAPHTLLEA